MPGAVPRFFVPAATPENEESVYANFAEACRAAVPPRERRIYSITYVHDGEEWTATVGKELRGVRRRTVRRRGQSTEQETRVSDPALVLAIFAGYPYMVVTNAGIDPGVRSAWVNPFMAGQPRSVTYFAP